MTSPISPAAVSESEFRALLGEVDTKLEDINGAITTIFDRSNRALLYLPPGVGDTLRATLRDLVDAVVAFGESLAKILANPGWAPGLFSTAGQWTTTIGGSVSAMSGQIAADQLRIDDVWQGPAAEAYAATLPAQQKAIEAVKAATDALDTNLQKAAGGILALWVGILVPLSAYLLELLLEGGAAATGVGAAPAAAAATASTIKVIGLVAAVLVAFTAYTTLVFDSMSSMRQVLHSNTAFPAGRWPRSNASDFSDGSLEDGDTTDWRIDPDG